VPATREMMTELSRYRQHLGLSALPSQNEDTPLVLPIGATFDNGGVETRPALTRAALHAIVKDVFANAAALLRKRDASAGARADMLEKASAHWLRHSAGSHMADQRVDLRLVRDNLGHASLTTTSLYLHVDDDRRHQETDEKHRIDW
jgi:integrase/recombinase XerD